MNGFGAAANEAVTEAGISRGVLELMFVRISQINGCAFCLDMHSRQAVEAGIPADLLAFIPAWREASVFTLQEQAVFAVGEAVTELPEINQRRVTLDWARSVLGDEAFGAIEWAAIAMNAYNRISIVSEHPTPNPRS